MKRRLILVACAAVLMSGCRCGSPFPWSRNRGAPCTSSISFDAAPACGIDGFSGGQVTSGYPDCCPGTEVGGPGVVTSGPGVVTSGPAYYDSGTMVPAAGVPTLPGGEMVPGMVSPPNTMPSPP